MLRVAVPVSLTDYSRRIELSFQMFHSAIRAKLSGSVVGVSKERLISSYHYHTASEACYQEVLILNVMEHLLCKIKYGDFATWAGSLSAFAGLIFLALNLRTQSKQLALQQSEIQDQKTTAVNKIKMQQASAFSFWVESGKLNPLVHFINDSMLPVTKVCVYAMEIGSTKPTTIYGSDKKPLGFRYVPQGNVYFCSLPENTFDLSKSVEVHFTDSAGVRWSRSSDGFVLEIFNEIEDGSIKWLDAPQEENT